MSEICLIIATAGRANSLVERWKVSLSVSYHSFFTGDRDREWRQVWNRVHLPASVWAFERPVFVVACCQ